MPSASSAIRSKAALITGGARRIGAAIAQELAHAGWHVLIHYRSSQGDAELIKHRIEAKGGSAETLSADLSDPSAATRLIDDAFTIAPGLELIVNNASYFPHDTSSSVSAVALADCFAVNASAPILISRRFAELLPAERSGIIVNVLDNRIFAPNPDFFSYGVSKHALYGATRMLALALAPRIRVNGIAPGITLVSGAQTEQNFAAAHALNPLGRGCSPDEIAAAVQFIAASAAMTGSIITIDGGQALANPGRDVQFIVQD